MEHDKGLRKFQAMIIGIAAIFIGYILAGWRHWSEALFTGYCWAVFGLVAGFSGFNVSEKIWSRFQGKPKAKP